MPDTVAERGRWRVLLKEVSAFLVVGGANFVIDLGVYQLTYAHLNQGALVSKVVSTTVTSTIAYFLHRHWSFSHRARSGLRREFVLFVILSALSLLLGLVIIGTVRYGFGQTGVATLQAANVLSIVIGAVFRFWAYKRWVFMAPTTDDAPAAS
ncbi:MAG: GtrA family protein [Aeromicrobium sp.]|jgi:putative flippase GtrA